MELYDVELENVVVGSLISDVKAYDEAKELLNEECFHVTQNRQLYRCICELVECGKDADIMAVHGQMLSHGWNCTIADIAGVCAQRTFNITQQAAALLDLSVRRKMVEMAERIKVQAADRFTDPNEMVSQYTQQLDSLYRQDSGGIVTLSDTLYELTKNMERNMADNGGMTGTPTGFKKFDDVSNGLQSGDLIVIAAESSQGKTSLAMNMATNAAMQGAKVAVYSMEMSRMQLAARMVSGESDVSSSSILYHRLSEVQYVSATDAASRLSVAKIFFDDRATSSMGNILASIRHLKRKENIDGAVVDYLQLLSLSQRNGSTDEQALAEYARQLKNIAKELGIWVIALSQLNRDKLNPEPNNNRLRGSGQILEAADVVMLLYRPEVYNKDRYPEPFQYVRTDGTAMITISKGRNIGLMQFIVGFDAAHTRFFDIDEATDDWKHPNIALIKQEEQRAELRKQEAEKLPF